MRKISIHNILQWVAVAAVLFLFCYFRVKPIFFQTVPYTYDQGRDFLKAEEIVRYANPTFIGPTTGIQGLHHGAWWYYFLSAVFFIFNGWPQGFYYGILFITLTSTFLFYLFLKKNFHFLTAFLFLLIVTVSPYFIRISFFPGNNILTPICVLLFLFSGYMFFKTQKGRYLFLLGLSLGFINETEVSFGFFLLPAFVISALLFKEFRYIFKNKIFIALLFTGMVLPFAPRVLFNLKNNFIEITDSIKFLQNTAPTNPQTLWGAFKGRAEMFVKYYIDIIYDHNISIALGLFLGSLSAFILGFKKNAPHTRKAAIFFTLAIILTFLTTLANKNNFFWDNYLEGMQYIMLFVILIGFDSLIRLKQLSRSAYLIVGLFILINILMFSNEIQNKKKPEPIGLRGDVLTIDYLYKQTNNKDFCVKIYTPPIVPYTYNYLISYYSKVKKFKEPVREFKNNSCWFIIDKETVEERIVEWRKNNTPENAKLKKSHTMENGVKVEYWEL